MSKKYRFPKINHRVNRLVRKVNKDLAEDPLWKGRFELRQIAKNVYRYPDNSGFCFYWTYRIYDKKTGIASEKRFNNYELLSYSRGWKMWEFVNDFIIKVSGVWEENPGPDYNSPSFVGVEIPKQFVLKEIR